MSRLVWGCQLKHSTGQSGAALGARLPVSAWAGGTVGVLPVTEWTMHCCLHRCLVAAGSQVEFHLWNRCFALLDCYGFHWGKSPRQGSSGVKVRCEWWDRGENWTDGSFVQGELWSCRGCKHESCHCSQKVILIRADIYCLRLVVCILECKTEGLNAAYLFCSICYTWEGISRCGTATLCGIQAAEVQRG